MPNWIYADDNIILEKKLPDIAPSIQRIMKRRGVKEDDFADFISQTPKNTHDPFLLDDLKEVCKRLLCLCKEGKSICVYGDYDADGITSTALMVGLLRHFSHRISYYIPSRFDDGYGPNKAAFDKIAAQGTDAIITVDCGITSKDEIDYAKSLGIECIVTDHHILREGMSPDCLTVNPHRSPNYPYQELSGCGVAFKIAQGIERISPDFTKADLNSFLDLVAISTVADVVPLLGENRVLVKYGLDRINRRQRTGLQYLISQLSLNDNVDASGISYAIAPNINALGRMDRADRAVELLLSEIEPDLLQDAAYYIVETNIQRKKVQEQTADICRNALDNDSSGVYAPVIYAPGAHEGVAGIVAGNLKEELGKPVCIVSPAEDGSLKGTGRSIPGINLHKLFENCGDVFERFGGHAGACGFTVKAGKLEEFREKMQSLVKAMYDENPFIFEKNIYLEKELDPEEKNLGFADQLRLLEPFGEGNPVPLFSMTDAQIYAVKCIGSDEQHVRFMAKTTDGIPVSCIAFGGTQRYLNILNSGCASIAGELGINEYRGRKQLQLKVVDVKESI